MLLFTNIELVADIMDGRDHVQTHLHTAVGVIWPRPRQPRHTVVAVSKQFDAEAVVLLQAPARSWSGSGDRDKLGKGQRSRELIDWINTDLWSLAFRISWSLFHQARLIKKAVVKCSLTTFKFTSLGEVFNVN